MEQITITIAKDGTTQVAVKGVKGRECLERTKNFEMLLGAKVEDYTTGEICEQSTVIHDVNRS